MVLRVFVLLSFVTGLARLPWWSALVWPIASVGLGAYAVANEAPAYDMHGLGYAAGGVAAVICLVAWLAGRGVRALTRRDAARPSK